MSLANYLHEKAAESRHNETLAYLVFLAGAVFYVGGVLETLNLGVPPQWFLFVPYQTSPIEGAILGMALVISGISFVVVGIVAGIGFAHSRGWYMGALKNVNSVEEAKLSQKPEKPRRARKSVKA
jgi:hypothetical protein